MENGLEQQVLAKAQKWLDGNYDAETKKQVKYLMDNDMKELVESFYKDLEFGTGGLRGVMGVGTNRMNIYTVGAATQGLSNYLKKNFAGEQIRVAIGHDSRNNSRMFAERVADIFASNGFTVFLFDALRPTPELSFAIRELKCQSGVVVTASHNPKEYNGYKAYWSDGSQVTAPHDKNIIAEVEKITDVDMILTGKNPENITILDEKFDEIVEFSELQNFLDVPLKNYSSGMVARIGFAIATITKPDILIADEVLSVGDFLFQQKCEKRMQELMAGGTTVILVSHSIEQIERMCSKVAWLSHGHLKMNGDTATVCAAYKATQRGEA